MAPHSGILPRRIPCTEEPGGLQFTVSDLHTTEQLSSLYPEGGGEGFKERKMVRHGGCSKILWFYASLRDELPSDSGGGVGNVRR